MRRTDSQRSQLKRIIAITGAYCLPAIAILVAGFLPLFYEPNLSSSPHMLAWTYKLVKPHREQILTAVVVSAMLSAMATATNTKTKPIQIFVALTAITATVALNITIGDGNKNYVVGLLSVAILAIPASSILYMRSQDSERDRP